MVFSAFSAFFSSKILHFRECHFIKIFHFGVEQPFQCNRDADKDGSLKWGTLFQGGAHFVHPLLEVKTTAPDSGHWFQLREQGWGSRNAIPLLEDKRDALTRAPLVELKR